MAMPTPIIPAITKVRKLPLPWLANATGAMIKMDAVGVMPETVMQILPSTPMARESCCSYLLVTCVSDDKREPPFLGVNLLQNTVDLLEKPRTVNDVKQCYRPIPVTDDPSPASHHVMTTLPSVQN